MTAPSWHWGLNVPDIQERGIVMCNLIVVLVWRVCVFSHSCGSATVYVRMCGNVCFPVWVCVCACVWVVCVSVGLCVCVCDCVRIPACM